MKTRSILLAGLVGLTINSFGLYHLTGYVLHKPKPTPTTTSRPTPTPIGSNSGWYWGVQPPNGPAFWVGPYKSGSECADMYGSAIYAHPFACHLTGNPSDCGIIGNGFCYPKGYPYPANPVICGNLNCQLMNNDNNPNFLGNGWYFLVYTATGGRAIGASSAKQCATLYQQYAGTGSTLGYYSDSKCPGAPCFTVGSDTACE